MPLYHFNLSDGVRYQDEDGTELADLDAARVEAVRHAAELMKDQPNALWADGALEVLVTDHTGLSLLMVTVLATNAPAATRS